jgi:3-oxoacyl-[acyl-carrier-protein] synthase I
MDTDDVVVLNVGMITAVGLTAAETAASVRAATSRFSEITWRDGTFLPFKLACVPDDGCHELVDALRHDPNLTYRETRMLRLGTAPLMECLKPFPSAQGSAGLILALPDRETLLPFHRQRFLARFAQQCNGAFDLRGSHCTFSGRAGGLLAVGLAAELIRSGERDWVIAGGIDSYRDLYLLGLLDSQRRLQASGNRDGFIPGEGACFMLLASRRAAAQLGASPIASVLPVASSFEEGHLYSDAPYRGEGLATAFREFFASAGLHGPVAEVYSSMNGESHWVKEWGVAFMRNKAAFASEHRVHHPADCFGDTGAAAGPLLTSLGALAIARGHGKSPNLAYCSSDTGQRAVLAVIAA